MSGFLVIALLLCLLKDGVYKSKAWDDADFFDYCPPSRCIKHGPEIRYPFRLESRNFSSLCRAPSDIKLACSGDDTTLAIQSAVIPYKVTDIDYRHATLTLAPRVDDFSPSCRQKLMSAALPRSFVAKCEDRQDLYSSLLCYTRYATTVSCLRGFTPSNRAAEYIFGPISCLTSTSHFYYLVDGFADMSLLPLDCKVVPDSNFLMDPRYFTFKEQAESILNFSEIMFAWWDYGQSSDIIRNCTECEIGRRRCGFRQHWNQTFCMNHGIIS